MLRIKVIVHLLLLMAISVVFVSPLAAQEDVEDAHKAAIEQVYAEAFNAGNLDALDAIVAPDYVLHGFGDDQDLTAYKATLEAMRAALTDFEATIEVLIAEDDWAATRVMHTGTFDNDWLFNGETIAANGEEISWTAITLYQFNEDGLLVEEFTAFDMLDLLLQMNASPLPDAITFLITDRVHVPAVMGDTVGAEDMEEVNEEAFTHIIEDGINNGDFSAMETYMHEDYGLHEPFGDFNRSQFIDVIAGFRAAVPDLHVTIDAVLTEGDWLATRLIYEGTFSNPIDLGAVYVEATNEPIRFIINVIVQFNGEGIGLMDFKEYNRLSWLRQLEYLPEA